jgi:hypothetical protein
MGLCFYSTSLEIIYVFGVADMNQKVTSLNLNRSEPNQEVSDYMLSDEGADIQKRIWVPLLVIRCVTEGNVPGRVG